MDSSSVSQIFDFIRTLWTDIFVPFVSMLWDLAWQDPMNFVAVLIIIGMMIWAYQESARLGR